MNYQEAKKLLNENKSLENNKHNGKEISLMIIPISKNGMDEIFRARRRLDSLELVYTKYNDFDVIVFYDLDDFHLTGVLEFDNLLNILKN